MTDLVERVAEAIADTIHHGLRWPWVPCASSVPIEADDVRDMARAALAAMREPTEAMVVAALRADRGMNSPTTIAGDWRAMIDAALREGNTP